MTAPRDPAVAETLDLLRAWTPIRSVAGDRDGLARMAAALSDWLVRELGATLVPGAAAADPPIVHARLDLGAPRTVVLYNMYDVMPADPAGWSVDPFTGGEAELPGLGPAFLGRGAENNKGPLAGMLVAARRLLQAGRLGVNLEILVEGQEESGSGALRRYLAADPCPAGPADAVLFPSLCEYGGGPPRIYLGFKGIATGEIRVEGGAWGRAGGGDPQQQRALDRQPGLAAGLGPGGHRRRRHWDGRRHHARRRGAGDHCPAGRAIRSERPSCASAAPSATPSAARRRRGCRPCWPPPRSTCPPCAPTRPTAGQ